MRKVAFLGSWTGYRPLPVEDKIAIDTFVQEILCYILGLILNFNCNYDFISIIAGRQL